MLVEVRSEGEIRATLDAQGKLDGLPFQEEMVQFCGRRLRVFRRAERVFLDRHYYVGRLTGSVLLEGVRCDGQAHAGCQMGCLLLWKEAWLKPVAHARPDDLPAPARPALAARELPILQNGRFSCQATELVHAMPPLPWWDVRQYLRDFLDRDRPVGELVKMLRTLFQQKARRLFRLSPQPASANGQTRTPAVSLGLQPGDWVEVKPRREIIATLDATGRNRGLSFGPEMVKFCGGRFRVAKRVDRLIVEWSGQMRKISDTVALDGATCDGLAYRGCPRDCYVLWREAWLRRADEPAESPR